MPGRFLGGDGMSTPREAAEAAVVLIEHGFADYAAYILEDYGGRKARPALAIMKQGDTPRALPLLRELAAS